jgi:ferrochelatase
VPSPAHRTCYRAQCFKTVKAFVKETNLKQGNYSIAFQSRLGREPWMQPYTDKEIERLAKAGVKHLAVICPAFVSDCLETLEEIAVENAKIFRENGGENFFAVPCLNDSEPGMLMLGELALRELKGWI